jgi:Ribbon-helix-helix protein, copG family
MNGKNTKARKRKSKRTEEPTAASLEAMPEFNFERAKQFGRGPKALEAALKAGRMHRRRGHPGKDAERIPTSPRSLRLPDASWEELERRAEKQGTTVHALLRELVIEWLETA